MVTVGSGPSMVDPLVAAVAVDPALERSARELLADLMAGRLDAVSAQFDDNMHQQLPRQKLTELVRSVAMKFGRFQSIIEVAAEDGPDNRTIDLTAAYDKRPVTVSVVFDHESKVSGILITPK